MIRERVFIGAAGITTALALVVAAPASAHECYIASRSWQGDLMSGTRSQAWYQVDLAKEFAADPSLTTDDVSCLLTELAKNGVPLVFTIHVKGATGQDGVLADNNPNTWLVSNGTGVDHFFDVYGEAIFTSFGTCGVPFQV